MRSAGHRWKLGTWLSVSKQGTRGLNGQEKPALKTLWPFLAGIALLLLIPGLEAGFPAGAASSTTAVADEDPPSVPAAEPVKKPLPPAHPVSGTTWKKLRKAVPLVLWEPKTLRRAQKKLLRLWQDEGRGAVRLTGKQFAELGDLLRAGNPFTTTKRRSVTLDIPTGERGPDGKPEILPVRVEVSSNTCVRRAITGACMPLRCGSRRR